MFMTPSFSFLNTSNWRDFLIYYSPYHKRLYLGNVTILNNKDYNCIHITHVTQLQNTFYDPYSGSLLLSFNTLPLYTYYNNVGMYMLYCMEHFQC